MNYALREVFRRMWIGLGGGKEGCGLLVAGSGKQFLLTPFVCVVCMCAGVVRVGFVELT